LLVPFARLAARTENQRLKRFVMSPVYRPNVLGQPRSLLEIDVDIVSPDDTSAAEGEMLAMVDEILETTPGLAADDWVVLISHSDVLELALERVPRKHHAAVASAVAGISSRVGVGASRTKLLELGLPRSVIEELEAFGVSGDVAEVHTRLERLVAIDLRPKLSHAVAQLNDVIQAARSVSAKRAACTQLRLNRLCISSAPRGASSSRLF
jgi:translation initiation factor 2-alpha kinase 4